MAEDSSAAANLDGTTGKGKKGKGGLKEFVRKNKTLVAVGGVGIVYYLWKMHNEPQTAGEAAGEPEAVEAGSVGEASGTAELAAYEVGRAERLAEGSRQEVEEVEQEREEERAKRRESEREKREGGPTPAEPTPGEGAEPGSTPSVDIHGHTFPGATGSHISKTGRTNGGKAYIEYVISYPGRQEHWQYFPDSGYWRQVSASNAGAGSNKPPKGNPSQSNPSQTPGQSGKNTGKGKGGKGKPKIGLSHPGVPVATGGGSNNGTHPNAVNTGNRCINGGVGSHKAPPGYHLFCHNGFIWRAPNA